MAGRVHEIGIAAVERIGLPERVKGEHVAFGRERLPQHGVDRVAARGNVGGLEPCEFGGQRPRDLEGPVDVGGHLIGIAEGRLVGPRLGIDPRPSAGVDENPAEDEQIEPDRRGEHRYKDPETEALHAWPGWNRQGVRRRISTEVTSGPAARQWYCR